MAKTLEELDAALKDAIINPVRLPKTLEQLDKENRYGQVDVTTETTQKLTVRQLSALFADVFVYTVTNQPGITTFHGFSDQFRSVKSAEVIPVYTLEVKNGSVTFTEVEDNGLDLVDPLGRKVK